VAVLLDAIRKVNSDLALIASVAEADLFGSYAGGADDLGDVDMAVLLERRLPPGKEWAAASLERAEKTDRRMSHVDQITWERRRSGVHCGRRPLAWISKTRVTSCRWARR
jgi:predicted nucleotidyltransferase